MYAWMDTTIVKSEHNRLVEITMEQYDVCDLQAESILAAHAGGDTRYLDDLSQVPERIRKALQGDRRSGRGNIQTATRRSGAIT